MSDALLAGYVWIAAASYTVVAALYVAFHVLEFRKGTAQGMRALHDADWGRRLLTTCAWIVLWPIYAVLLAHAAFSWMRARSRTF